MNKKGQTTIFFLFMMGVLFIFLALALSPAITQTVDEQMNDTNLNCSTTTDDQAKAVCTTLDMQKLFIAVIFGLAGVILVGVAVR